MESLLSRLVKCLDTGISALPRSTPRSSRINLSRIWQCLQRASVAIILSRRGALPNRSILPKNRQQVRKPLHIEVAILSPLRTDYAPYTNTQPLLVAMAFWSSESLARLVVPILQVKSCVFSHRAFSSESRLSTESFGQPFIATFTFIVPSKRTSSNALHEVKVVSIWLSTLEKSSAEYIAVKAEQP